MDVKLWYYIQGEGDYFVVSIPPTASISHLKQQIHDEQLQYIVPCASSRVKLKKVRYVMNSM